ncbi:adenosylcobinamide-phosphate synthase CbiB [Tundrisphaera lichenicola]|uniref:adenosylcobinamide-phosphate synthase CbiB n=1 Tax=Tundrisphaera lichenicola TaxID=2029860 RepID=UPI003EBD80EF
MSITIQQVGADYWGLAAFPLGVALDLILGDPRGWPHPVLALEWLIRWSEQALRIVLRRLGGGPTAELVAGVILALFVVGCAVSIVWLLTDLAGLIGGPATLVVRALLIYWGLAIRSLGDEALRASEAPDLATARRELSRIVGRDTAHLDDSEIARACIETVGENTNNAVVAPLFWFAIGGPAGLWAYKAVNTLDGKVGHRSLRYRYLGRFSARIDDLANLIPARMTWLLIALAATLVGERGLAALRIGWRDGRKHPGSNAAWGEAAIAGALGVRLGGRATYGGVPDHMPFLGDPIRPITRETVIRAVFVMQIAALIAAGVSWSSHALFLGSY